MTQSSANTTCRGLNGSLVMIKTEAVQIFLQDKVKSLYGNNGIISFWVGGYKYNNQWMWEDYTLIGFNGSYSHWAPGKPSGTGNGMLISSWHSVGPNLSGPWMSLDWLDEDGTSTKSGFICEISSGKSCTKLATFLKLLFVDLLIQEAPYAATVTVQTMERVLK